MSHGHLLKHGILPLVVPLDSSLLSLEPELELEVRLTRIRIPELFDEDDGEDGKKDEEDLDTDVPITSAYSTSTSYGSLHLLQFIRLRLKES